MLDSKGFDLWAGGYDENVRECEASDEYPFAGYKDVLNGIYGAVRNIENARVLDIGFGTGVLTKKLYDDGYEIFGIDFSGKMIKIAQAKMPNAVLLQHDFTNGLPNEFAGIRFDRIVSTYALHHLSDEAKLRFIADLQDRITADGMILIGDIAFESRAKLDMCKETCGHGWDADELYFVFDEFKRHFPAEKIEFHRVSHCAGIIVLTK
jgi:putative AdoMet-dependent methyltransferase